MLSKFPRNPLIYLAPLALLLAAFLWLPQTSRTHGSESNQYRSTHTFAQRGEGVSPNNSQRYQKVGDRDDRRPPEREGPRDGGRRHHGPPPCGVPPTVLFLIGGALGFLLGRKPKGCGPRCGPRHRRPDGPESASDSQERSE